VANPTTDGSAVSKKWVTDHVSGSTINTGGFTMTGNIDMGGHTIEKIRLSSPDNPNRESVPNTGWVTDKFMSKVGGLVVILIWEILVILLTYMIPLTQRML
jgi:hypothetical protein